MKKQTILISILALTLLHCNGIRRQVHWFMDMAYSPAVDSQQNAPSEGSNVVGVDEANRRVGNMLPPENTVPYKFLNPIYATDAPGIYFIGEDQKVAYRFNGTDYNSFSIMNDSELAPLLAVLKSPWKNRQDSIARGQERFRIYCSPCHGVEGKGDGTVAEKWGGVPALRRLTPGEPLVSGIESWSEAKYFVGISLGVRTMPSYASQIPERDRWAIAAYVKKLQSDAKK